VTRKLDSLFVSQQVGVLMYQGRNELACASAATLHSFLVAVTAVFRGEKAFRIDKLAGIVVAFEVETDDRHRSGSCNARQLLCVGSAICRRILTHLRRAAKEQQAASARPAEMLHCA